MKNVSPDLIIALCAILGIALFVEISLVGTYSSMPTNLTPSDSVAVLTGEGFVLDGKPCQGNFTAFVSPVSKEKDLTWYRAESVLWPTDTEISVIYPDGSVDWVKMKSIIKLPAEESDLLCPALNP